MKDAGLARSSVTAGCILNQPPPKGEIGDDVRYNACVVIEVNKLLASNGVEKSAFAFDTTEDGPVFADRCDLLALIDERLVLADDDGPLRAALEGGMFSSDGTASEPLTGDIKLKVGHHLSSWAKYREKIPANSGEVLQSAIMVTITFERDRGPFSSIAKLDLPGGKREVCESCFDAGLRQTLEESRVDVRRMIEEGSVERSGSVWISGVVFWSFTMTEI